MPNYYYSTQPYIAWCLNRHVYGGLHYVYVAPFYPYRKPNPKSSNPLEIYKDLYQPWYDRDDFDKYITQYRIGLRKGVLTRRRDGLISEDTTLRLERVCDKVDVRFFCPIIYRVDLDAIDASRLRKSGSGLTAESDEFLITDLHDGEFDILFVEPGLSDEPLSKLFTLTAGDAETALQLLSEYAVSTST